MEMFYLEIVTVIVQYLKISDLLRERIKQRHAHQKSAF